MKIEGNTIIFKSTPENFFKEKSDLKSNTIRRISFLSEMKQIELFYTDFLFRSCKIKIINSVSCESFERTLTDITIFEGLYIFSWRHE